jgi:hypothetical protein
MLEPIGKRAQGERLDSASRFFLRLSIRHNARERRDLRDPATVFFPVEFDSQHATSNRQQARPDEL